MAGRPTRQAYMSSSDEEPDMPKSSLVKTYDGSHLGLGRPDIWLCTGRQRFRTHKDLLATESDYFRAMFESGMRECKQEEVDLEGFSGRVFELLLDFLYTGKLSVKKIMIEALLAHASFLQMRSVMEHIKYRLDNENCMEVLTYSEVYGVSDLEDSAYRFLKDHFKNGEDILGKLKYEQQERFKGQLRRYLVGVGTHAVDVTSLYDDQYRLIQYFDEDKDTWEKLTALPSDCSTISSGIAVLNNKLYITGGQADFHKVISQFPAMQDKAFCYDPAADSWSEITPMHQQRKSFSLVALDGKLYAIGGRFGDYALQTVEVYNPRTDTWDFVSPLPYASSDHAATTCAGHIYVCVWHPPNTTDIYRYSPRTDRWEMKATLRRTHSYGHCMVSYRDVLYVIRNGPDADFLRCEIDCFNVTTNQWSSLKGHYINRRGCLFKSAIIGNTVYTVNKLMTLPYTIDNEQWVCQPSKAGFPRSGTTNCFTLCLPKKPRKEVPE
ncbi:kelch repeat and BTB domain-containing protein 13-like [Branchiostoma floridae]|uniref:Kelch repeat and BTB domain-containing protein 13-like n=1 Tax=Branchiostoma floridae TaxID=7739 RepID=C3YKX7_BRAFL|nr:kelch repeat and BTB domain-containing protein 13-like [Branchiostoma floridae]XP_035668846.1 kelch repeat and BTB domain-containing protein 13-like [Branchiostoma floridae]XP_035668847.1 kelch repeat and BTB domain-containing protein 13-like [Branchiostoma floridae]|eukprot:XP_002603053.1 hypothetical protein BRAFLDRAFT_286665 [Branchiostoma floridae]